jgi:hypothetical protein
MPASGCGVGDGPDAKADHPPSVAWGSGLVPPNQDGPDAKADRPPSVAWGSGLGLVPRNHRKGNACFPRHRRQTRGCSQISV